MPADARLLFRARVASAVGGEKEGIKDRFASYHPKTRALRCSACDYLAIKHESLWASHAASKSHRTNVAKIRSKEEEEADTSVAVSTRDENTDTLGSKRKGPTNSEMPDGLAETSKKARTAVDGPLDLEWERFQKEVLQAPISHEQPSLTSFADATIEVGPSLRPGMEGQGAGKGDEVAEEEEDLTSHETETEADRRIRLEREEREEILARLEEEQRLQDEADERVTALRHRFESIKRARAAKRQ